MGDVKPYHFALSHITRKMFRKVLILFKNTEYKFLTFHDFYEDLTMITTSLNIMMIFLNSKKLKIILLRLYGGNYKANLIFENIKIFKIT